MRRQFILAIFVVSSLFAGIYGAHRWHAARQVAQRAMNRQSVVTVSAATVGRARILPRTAVVGEIVAAQGAELSLQSSGVIRRVAFHSGQRVRAGALLLRIDAGALPGQLQAAQAKAALASENFGRAQRVHAIHGISTAALDRAKYEALASAARVTALKENLADTTLRAPFAGVLGIRKVDRGEYLRAGSPVVELIAPRNLYVDFSVPQGIAARVQAGSELAFALSSSDPQQYAARILAVNAQVDRSSRSLVVRARILQTSRSIRAGMFVLVHLPTAAARTRLVIPRIAVAYHSYGSFVYVLQRRAGGSWVAHAQIIRTGTVQGDDIVVRSGLTAGEMIVTAGQVKLHNGDAVRINNAVHLD